MLDQLKIVDFQPHLNQQFSIRFTPEAIHPAQLTRLTPWGSETDKFRQPFTLEFETDLKEIYYLQGIFVLVHPVHGDLELFMVPIGTGSTGMKYEVIFS